MNDSIFDLMIAPWKTAVLNTAVRLKLFTVLSDRQMPGEELADRTNANEAALQAVLNALVCMGLLHIQQNKYMNSHLSRIYLVEGGPHYVGDFIQLVINESSRWDNLFSIVSEGKPISKDSVESHRTFIKAMHNMGMIGEADALTRYVDLSGCKKLIDAGGGSGIYSISLCQKYPGLTSIIMDCRETLAVTKDVVSKHENSDRIGLRECDITKDKLGENIDAVLLSDVTYDETEAGMILRNVWKCLRSGGLLIIRGYYFDPQVSAPLFGALFTINQWVIDPNRKIITLPSLKNVIGEIGYVITKSAPLTERSFLILATKPGS